MHKKEKLLLRSCCRPQDYRCGCRRWWRTGRRCLQTDQLWLCGGAQYAVNIIKNWRDRQESLREWWRRQKGFGDENLIWHALLEVDNFHAKLLVGRNRYCSWRCWYGVVAEDVSDDVVAEDVGHGVVAEDVVHVIVVSSTDAICRSWSSVGLQYLVRDWAFRWPVIDMMCRLGTFWAFSLDTVKARRLWLEYFFEVWRRRLCSSWCLLKHSFQLGPLSFAE